VAVQLVYETHSTTTDNEAGVATGWLPGELSATGIENSRDLGRRRRDDGIDVVYASDLHRAVQTAEIAFSGSGIPVYHDSRLRECDYGDWNGMPRAKLEDERARRIDVPFPGGQSWREVVVRMADLLRDLAARHDGQRIVLIGHAATRYALAVLLGGADLHAEVTGPFHWREGWKYTLPAGWDGGFEELTRFALSTEAAAFAEALHAADWAAPTRCEPWDVRDLAAHVQVAVGRTGQMISDPPPGGTPVDALGYYTTPGIFTPDVNQARLDSAHAAAATVDAASFARMWAETVAVTSETAHDRLVRTRHGHTMRLHEFLVTRVAELALHGLDVADALDREPWLTEPAAQIVDELLRRGSPPLAGWSRLEFIRKATGRAALTEAETAEIAERGLRWLTLAPG
jgi:uncharacterized protein (TIGR03083 family)